MKYPEDDQNEINRLHNDFVHHSPRSNDDLIALQDASYALGLKRGQAHEAALQQRLNEADQRIDEAERLLARCVKSVREQRCDEGEADFDLPVTIMTEVDAFLGQLTKDSPEVGS